MDIPLDSSSQIFDKNRLKSKQLGLISLDSTFINYCFMFMFVIDVQKREQGNTMTHQS